MRYYVFYVDIKIHSDLAAITDDKAEENNWHLVFILVHLQGQF